MFSRFATPQAFLLPSGALPRLREVAQAVAQRIGHVQTLHASRRDLAELEPRLLSDIGLTPEQARSEAARLPWDVAPPRRSSGPRRFQPGRGSWQRAADSASNAARTVLRRWRTRRSITGLDAHDLRDIGVTFAEAEQEANKPFWRM